MNYKNLRLLLLISLITLLLFTGLKLFTVLQQVWPQTQQSVTGVHDQVDLVVWDFPNDISEPDAISPVWTLAVQERSPATISASKPSKTKSGLEQISSLHDDRAAASRQFFIAGVLVDGQVKVVDSEPLLSQAHRIGYDEPTHSAMMSRNIAVN